ncbi:MAG TPA: bifunctional DNA-formamidopyrimidine glycosylase/DNA-(apurinic or apyrimidinic site) lyase [Candidatus Saccharimonadales bacterium]|nr:bifunctional DNA-formamidopyrimidine glycosylase/DNA-(apurinic or apyrimidinic site) lyase [Candidatus Saccharimonadales bacterium]
MPELPEVETVRIGLSAFLPGKTVARSWSDAPKSFPNSPSDVRVFLHGAKIVAVMRRAKVLIIELSSKYSLVIHLKMTGQLVYRGEHERFGAGHPNDSLVGELPDKTTHVILEFTDGSKLFFNDQRKFGWMRLMPTAEVPHLDFFQKVGPEPLAADFTAPKFVERLRRRNKSKIKAVLLDQTVVAGIGNIYADESLWGAKIHPNTIVGELSDAKLKKLYTALLAVLKLSIERGGSTDRNYVNAEGKRGSYLSFANVFRREGKPCPRCGTAIIKIRAAGRGTHLCPHCQKLKV